MQAEGLSRAILEYKALQLPIVAGQRRPTASCDRLAGAPNNPQSIADGLLRLLRDADLGSHLGKNGRTFVSLKFSFVGLEEQLESLYAELLRAAHSS